MDLPDPGIKPGSPALQVESLPLELPGKPSRTYIHFKINLDLDVSGVKVKVLMYPQKIG